MRGGRVPQGPERWTAGKRAAAKHDFARKRETGGAEPGLGSQAARSRAGISYILRQNRAGE